MTNNTKKVKAVKKAEKKLSPIVAKKTKPAQTKITTIESTKKVSKTDISKTKGKNKGKTPTKITMKPIIKDKKINPSQKPASITVKTSATSVVYSKLIPEKPINQPEAKHITQPPTQNKKLVNKLSTKPTATPTATNSKTRYSDKELAEFKAILTEKVLTSRQELTYLLEQIVEMNENNADIQGSDWFDDSSIHAEVELLNNMAIRQRQFIQNLENALVRIENKTYGICVITGALIDKKRLMLVPHATKSIEAKHIEQATMIPEINQVAPDERVLRRTAEGKSPKKAGNKKTKGKSAGTLEDEDGDDMTEVPAEDLDMAFEGGDD